MWTIVAFRAKVTAFPVTDRRTGSRFDEQITMRIARCMHHPYSDHCEAERMTSECASHSNVVATGHRYARQNDELALCSRQGPAVAARMSGRSAARAGHHLLHERRSVRTTGDRVAPQLDGRRPIRTARDCCTSWRRRSPPAGRRCANGTPANTRQSAMSRTR